MGLLVERSMGDKCIMPKGNKRSLYINDDNLEYLKQEASKTKKKSVSQILNRLIENVINNVSFKRKSNEGYTDVTVSLRIELVDVLEVIREKHGDDAVAEFVNYCVLKVLNKQGMDGRARYPDRVYCGDNYIIELAKKCKKFLFGKR